MSDKLTIIAHIRALDGKVAETRVFLEGLVAPTRAETGCLDYVLHQDDEHPEEFTFYENWADRAAWNAHMETPHLREMKQIEGRFFEVERVRKMTML